MKSKPTHHPWGGGRGVFSALGSDRGFRLASPFHRVTWVGVLVCVGLSYFVRGLGMIGTSQGGSEN